MAEKWTPDMVIARLEEAAAIMHRLPPVRVQGYVSTWPPIIREFWEAYGWDEPRVRLGPPSAEAISRMDATLEWLRWLEPDDVRLVWLRAERVNWKLITSRFGRSRSTLAARWKAALFQIVAILNCERNLSGHLRARHPEQNLLHSGP